MTEISIREARRLFLDCQGLLRREPFGRGKDACLRAIERLGYVQIDTISVMARAHHHTLGTRVPNYAPVMIDRLQSQDRRIFEYWSHAAAYLPMSDYRFYRPMMRGFAEQPLPDVRLAQEILARLRAEGPMQSKDFESPEGRASTGWWDWKPAKRALESLFLRGDLMITRRDGFQKVYDLPENVLPQDVDTRMPTREEWCRFIVLRMLGALAVGTAMDLGYARTTIRRFTGSPIQKGIECALQALVAEGLVIPVQVVGQTMYTLPALAEQLPLRPGRRQLRFLSPFDNLVINRDRTRRLFDFDYQIECYLPASKRQFGYYCLPILWGDELIGRLDAKAERKQQALNVHLLQIEPECRVSEALLGSLVAKLMLLARANECNAVRLARTDPGYLKSTLASRMR